MLPTSEQIQVAAYHLWEQHGCRHGHDREDWEAATAQLMYTLNYEPVLEYELNEPRPRVVGQQATRYCRFCERDAKRVRFAPPSAIVSIVPNSSLLTAAICQECQSDCRDPSNADLRRFWESLRSTLSSRGAQSALAARNDFSLGAYKALVAAALLILPDRDLPYFLDALEWVSNPDPDVDEQCFAGTDCRAYRAPEEYARAWVSLARRIDDDAPLPYMIAFLSCQGVTVQIYLPFCSRDEGSEEGGITLLERSFPRGHASTSGHGCSTLVPLVLSSDRGRPQGRRSLVEC